MRNNELIAALRAKVAEDQAYMATNPTAIDTVLRQNNVYLAQQEIAAQEALPDAADAE